MGVKWFRLEDYYEHDGDKYVFYPYRYGRGYRFSADQRAAMDGVLGPFLKGRLRVEFVVVFFLVTLSLMVAATFFLATASAAELDAFLAVPRWIWLLGAVALAGVILIPILFRLRSKIRHQLDEIGVVANEPPRPDLFIVDGEFSVKRLSYVFLGLGAILAVILLNG